MSPRHEKRPRPVDSHPKEIASVSHCSFFFFFKDLMGQLPNATPTVLQQVTAANESCATSTQLVWGPDLWLIEHRLCSISHTSGPQTTLNAVCFHTVTPQLSLHGHLEDDSQVKEKRTKIERDSNARTFALTRAKLSLPYKLEVARDLD